SRRRARPCRRCPPVRAGTPQPPGRRARRAAPVCPMHLTAERYDLLVIGGGPAGLAAVAEAAGAGLAMGLVDERPALGGQIYKQPGPGFRVRDHAALGRDHQRGRALIEAAQRSGAEILLRTSALHVAEGRVVLAAEGEPARTVEARHLLLAPGAHD